MTAMTTGPRRPLALAAGLLASVIFLALGGCAGSELRSAGAAAPAADRTAILAMTGDYAVTFDFRETVSFEAGYTPKEPYHSGAFEVVRVIRDEPRVIELQHILVVGADGRHLPIKHWRQKWVYEPDYVLDFIGNNRWRRRDLGPEEAAGRWAQFVYQVDDSPRYAALGDWRHDQGTAAWTSEPSLRPLPRRDATKREDYDAIRAVNRHALVPGGWVHEQDNTKLRLGEGAEGAAAPLVREVGVNRYLHSDTFAVAVAEDYWQETAAYWEAVRGLWTRLEQEQGEIGLTLAGEPEEMYAAFLGHADALASGERSLAAAVAEARQTLRRYTVDSTAIARR
ncbi:DUF6607 family protein [Pseudohaliea rubra]|uniref:Uncharacterized protein n=1 Tax=Pseudohaliea rubra DSM 19751 TaxID=1265313 RepID=A0A095VRX9_9GAMM|nr:DUF6607 family protein [Pseudohaliea rubra]KGE04212.1 hypothetical protein HRUBRA_01189 [Pseudohaliea rubra DSM 19751]